MNMSALRRISGAALTVAMMLAVPLTASAAAQAQYRPYDDRYDRYDRYDDNRVRWDRDRTRQYAFLLGYHNAYPEGREAYEQRFRGSYKDMQGYRYPTGHLAWMGHPDTYRDSYRKGYEQGFKDGYERRGRRYTRQDVERVLGDSLRNVYGRGDYDDDHYRGRRRDHDDYDRDGYGRYDRNQVYRIAQQNGYRSGLRHGEEDRYRRRGYDYDHSNEYRDAMSGYRSEYGDRELYRRGFRDGYQRGYDEGYRRGTSRNSGNRWPFPWPF